MSDRETILEILVRANIEFREDRGGEKLYIIVWPGYQAQTDMIFDSEGKLIDLGAGMIEE